ncbi:MAG: alpha/beta hydrolase [Dehalococcoidia bacterium]
MPFVELDGVNLYFEEFGSGPPVVFLHGGGGNHLVWWQQIPAFSEQYRCIAIDHRGFGQSIDASSEGATRFGDDLEGLLDHLGIDRAALVCQSMGGNTAMRFAVEHPERITALVMASTWGFIDWPEGTDRLRAALIAAAAAAPTAGTPALGARFKASNPAGTFLYGRLAALNPTLATGIADTLPMGAPTRDVVAQLRVPALFMIGLDDVLVALEDMREICALIPGATLKEFPGLGHSTYWEDPAVFNDTIGAFLAQHV